MGSKTPVKKPKQFWTRKAATAAEMMPRRRRRMQRSGFYRNGWIWLLTMQKRFLRHWRYRLRFGRLWLNLDLFLHCQCTLHLMLEIELLQKRFDVYLCFVDNLMFFIHFFLDKVWNWALGSDENEHKIWYCYKQNLRLDLHLNLEYIFWQE